MLGLYYITTQKRFILMMILYYLNLPRAQQSKECKLNIYYALVEEYSKHKQVLDHIIKVSL